MQRQPLALLAGFLWLAAANARGAAPDHAILICYNYGCATQDTVRISAAQLDRLAEPLRQARDAPTERARLAPLLGQLYTWAAGQLPIGADRAGNLADADTEGRMDCIDHATSTTRWLELLAAEGALRHHRVAEPLRRGLMFLHYSAHLIDRDHQDWAVDTWFGANGEPARIMPVAAWRDYGEDDVW